MYLYKYCTYINRCVVQTRTEYSTRYMPDNVTYSRDFLSTGAGREEGKAKKKKNDRIEDELLRISFGPEHPGRRGENAVMS